MGGGGSEEDENEGDEGEEGGNVEEGSGRRKKVDKAGIYYSPCPPYSGNIYSWQYWDSDTGLNENRQPTPTLRGNCKATTRAPSTRFASFVFFSVRYALKD